MPLAVSYPGVYVQSIVQPTPPASAVATSLAAFIGRMATGPVDEPVLLNSWGDYQRVFGGLAQDSSASYQVNAFFNNGGGQALGVRLFEPTYGDDEIGQEIIGGQPGTDLIAAAKAAADRCYASPPGGGPSPTREVVATTVSDVFATAAQAGGKKAIAAILLGNAWTTTSQALAGTPARTDVDTLIGSLAAGSYTFTATVTIDPVSPVDEAVGTFLDLLEIEAAVPKATIEQLSLVAKGQASQHPAQSPAGSVLQSLSRAVASAPTPGSVLPTVAAAIPGAYVGAIPALKSPGTDPVYGPAASAAAQADTVMTALGGAGGTVGTAQFAMGQAAAPNAVVKDIQAAVDGFVTTNCPNDKGAADLKTAIDAATTVADVAKAAADAVKAVVGPSGPSKAVDAADGAVDAHAAYPGSDLTTAIARAVMSTVASAWPAAAKPSFSAKTPGDWGNALTIGIDTNSITPAIAASLKVSNVADLFNITIAYEDTTGAVQTESFKNVTFNPAYQALYLPSVLEEGSNYVSFVEGSATLAVAGSAGSGRGGQASLPISMTNYLGSQSTKTGLYALERAPVFNVLCIPPDDFSGDTPSLVYQTAAQYCVSRNAMLIIDPPTAWQDDFTRGDVADISLDALGSFGAEAGRSSAVYFPRVLAADPLRNGQVRTLPNSGYVAGLWAQTDVQTGFWKAPAGLSASLNGVVGLAAVLSDVQNGALNPMGINCLRTFPLAGSVVWGARTLRGADQLGDQYNYIPVRRMLLYLMDWTLQNTKWAIFEPNDEVLWSSLRTQLSNLMNGLWKQGALFGTSADQAYFVKCDATTTLQADIDAGRVNVQIGFAPVKPAEFVIVTLQQKTAGSS